MDTVIRIQSQTLKLKIMKNSKLLAGILLGVAAGAVAGLLLAPDKGADTRKKIRRKGEDLQGTIKDKFCELVDSVVGRFEGIKEEAEDMMEQGADKARNLRAEAHNLLDKGKEKLDQGRKDAANAIS